MFVSSRYSDTFQILWLSCDIIHTICVKVLNGDTCNNIVVQIGVMPQMHTPAPSIEFHLRQGSGELVYKRLAYYTC